jgi:alpha-galactosidase
MSLIRVTPDRTFTLGNAFLTYAFRVTDAGLLEHLYYGPPVNDVPPASPRVLRHATVMFEDQDRLSLNALPQEYPTSGRGDFSSPAFVIKGGAHSIVCWHYQSHQIVEGKPTLSGLPSARGEGAQTLIVSLADPVQSLALDLHYTIWPDQGVMSRRAVVTNDGGETVKLRRMASTSLDLPPGDYEVQHFHGTWAREFNEERVSLPTARLAIDSSRGTSSNAHHPYLAFLSPEATETSGDCVGMTLIYSGNFEASVERGEFGRVRAQIGLNGQDFDWPLGPGQTFECPESLLAFSQAGTGGLSHVWHDFIRTHVTPKWFRDEPRGTYLNTWEAAYFDVTEENVLALADKAVALGVERLVLDDGWFKGRTDDRRALGDWMADPDRFPAGITALSDAVRQKGLSFGLWVEPEMVSPDSDLYRERPEWVLGVSDRTRSLGRNQLILDLSKPDVVEHIYGWLNGLLSEASIDYVKWDMNRNMTDVPSGAHAHRYMVGLYDLLRRLTDAHPDVLFENCASGGNRFDLGMLHFMPQGWISDMCDPVGRLSIIHGASHIYPPDVMAAYIGPSPNHQNGRATSVQARYLAGWPFASHGLSLNAHDLDTHADALKSFMMQSQQTAAQRLGARFDRLRHTDHETIWQQISRDANTVWVVAFQGLNAPNLPLRRVCLRGLDADALYADEAGQHYHGTTLMRAGVVLPMATADFDARLLTFQKLV